MRVSTVAVLLMGVSAPVARAEDRPIKVTVIAVLASEKKTHIDKELKQFAVELKKKYPSLKGFVLERTACESMKIGAKKSFTMLGDSEVVVHLREKDDKDNRVSLTVKAPTVGEIAYTTCCGKFFPVETDHVTKDGDRLIIAVMVKPCDGKK
jgi:hypothetical protein